MYIVVVSLLVLACGLIVINSLPLDHEENHRIKRQILPPPRPCINGTGPGSREKAEGEGEEEDKEGEERSRRGNLAERKEQNKKKKNSAINRNGRGKKTERD